MRYSEQEARIKVVEAGLKLLESGLTVRTWGNISARISDDKFLITPSGIAYDSLKPEDLSIVEVYDSSKWEGEKKPSSEKGVHAEAYKYRKDVDFIIHTHQYAASAVSISKDGINITDDDIKEELGSYIPCAPYGISSTKPLANNVSKTVKENPTSNAILMRSHGALILAQNEEQAFKRANLLEEVANKCLDKSDYINVFLSNHNAVYPYQIPNYGNSLKGEDNYTVDENGKIKNYTLKEKIEEATPGVRAHERIYKSSKKTCCVKHLTDKYVVAYSSAGISLPAVIDDLTQIAGSSVPCVKFSGSARQAADVAESILLHNMVLIKGAGAFCAGADEEEAEFACQILIKACRTALYRDAIGEKFKISTADSVLQKTVYTMKYSKLK